MAHAKPMEVVRQLGDYKLMTDGWLHRPDFPERERMAQELRTFVRNAQEDDHNTSPKPIMPSQLLYWLRADDGRDVCLAYLPETDRWTKFA